MIGYRNIILAFIEYRALLSVIQYRLPNIDHIIGYQIMDIIITIGYRIKPVLFGYAISFIGYQTSVIITEYRSR